MAEQDLWKSVLFRALIDATYSGNTQEPETWIEHGRAVDWITRGGRDFKTVVTFAGYDPDFIRDAFLAGRIKHENLKGIFNETRG